MASAMYRLLLLSALVLATLHAVTTSHIDGLTETLEKRDLEVQSEESDETMDEMSLGTDRILDRFDPLYLPYIPMLGGNHVSLSLTNVTLEGLSSTKLTLPEWKAINKTASVLLPSLKLTSNRYVAGGHINGMPFAGKSILTLTAEKINVTVSYQSFERTYCALPNSSAVFIVSMDRFIVEFQDLCPGTNLGELVNSMASNLHDDLAKWITLLLNANPELGQRVVNAINDFINTGPFGCDDFGGEDMFDGTVHLPQSLLATMDEEGGAVAEIIRKFVQDVANMEAIVEMPDKIRRLFEMETVEEAFEDPEIMW